MSSKTLRRSLSAALLATVALTACKSAGPIETDDTAPIDSLLFDVPYSDAAALVVRDEDRRLDYGPDALQFALGWLPKGTPRALVVFIHGGCWLSAYDLEHVRAATSALADAGYEAWAIEYRRSGDQGGGWPGSLDDVVAAVRALHAESDTRPLLLMGHSAGGHLGLLAAARLRDEVASAFGLAAITDVVAYAGGDSGCERATLSFFDGSPEERPASYREATVAAEGLGGRAVLLHGEADSIVPVAQAEVAGLDTELLGGVGHFDWVHPGSHAFKRLLEELEHALEEGPAAKP